MTKGSTKIDAKIRERTMKYINCWFNLRFLLRATRLVYCIFARWSDLWATPLAPILSPDWIKPIRLQGSGHTAKAFKFEFFIFKQCLLLLLSPGLLIASIFPDFPKKVARHNFRKQSSLTPLSHLWSKAHCITLFTLVGNWLVSSDFTVCFWLASSFPCHHLTHSLNYAFRPSNVGQGLRIIWPKDLFTP